MAVRSRVRQGKVVSTTNSVTFGPGTLKEWEVVYIQAKFVTAPPAGTYVRDFYLEMLDSTGEIVMFLPFSVNMVGNQKYYALFMPGVDYNAATPLTGSPETGVDTYWMPLPKDFAVPSGYQLRFRDDKNFSPDDRITVWYQVLESAA